MMECTILNNEDRRSHARDICKETNYCLTKFSHNSDDKISILIMTTYDI